MIDNPIAIPARIGFVVILSRLSLQPFFEVKQKRIIKKHTELNNEWKTVTTDLEKKYGQVNVNLEDGTLTPLESSEAKYTSIIINLNQKFLRADFLFAFKNFCIL